MIQEWTCIKCNTVNMLDVPACQACFAPRTIAIEKEAIKKYINECIEKWRDNIINTDNYVDKFRAACYIDAFQSMRVSLFGSLLPTDEEKEKP